MRTKPYCGYRGVQQSENFVVCLFFLSGMVYDINVFHWVECIRLFERYG